MATGDVRNGDGPGRCVMGWRQWHRRTGCLAAFPTGFVRTSVTVAGRTSVANWSQRGIMKVETDASGSNMGVVRVLKMGCWRRASTLRSPWTFHGATGRQNLGLLQTMAGPRRLSDGWFHWSISLAGKQTPWASLVNGLLTGQTGCDGMDGRTKRIAVLNYTDNIAKSMLNRPRWVTDGLGWQIPGEL